MGLITNLIAGAAGTAASLAISGIFYVLFIVIGQATAVIVKLFSISVYVRAYSDIPVITGTWTIFRDFCNMLFIVALIWMAFATMFDAGKMKFSDNIWKLVIVAVLINFSLAIGGLVVDASQVVTNVFLNTIGNPGERIGQYLNPSLFITDETGRPNPELLKSLDITLASGFTLIAAVILSGMFMFSMLVATLFSIFRIFFIWGLLIVSPLAWISYIFPGTRQYFKMWWDNFLGWNLYLPVYLFFLYIGLVFLSQRDTIIEKIAGDNGGQAVLSGLTNSYSFSMFFFYAFAVFILGYGTIAAKQVTSSFGGKGIDKWVKNSRDWVGKMTGYDIRRQAAQQAVQNRIGQFQQQGFQNRYLNKIYGGKEGDKRLLARYSERVGRMTGSREMVYGAQKQFTTDAKRQFDLFTDQYDTGRLSVEQLRVKVNSMSASTPEGYAYHKLAIQKGAMNEDQFKDSLIELQNNPFAVKDLVDTAKAAKFAGLRKLKDVALSPELSRNPNLVTARRALLDHLKTDPKSAGSFKIDDLRTAVDDVLHGSDSPEAKAFLGDFGKLRPDLVYEYRSGGADAYTDPFDDTKTISREEFWDKAVRVDAKNLVDMPKDVWKDLDFQEALQTRHSELRDPKQRNALRNNLDRMLTEKGERRTGARDAATGELEDRLDILDNILPLANQQGQAGRGNQQNPPGGNPAQNQGPVLYGPNNQPINPGTTISYRVPAGVNQNNVIDLRKNRGNIDIEEA